MVSAVLLLCLTILLIVGTVAGDDKPAEPPEPSTGTSSPEPVDG